MADSFRFRSCAAVPPAPVAWLWEPYLARGRLAVLDGDPGAGKSLVAADLVARLSRGAPFPGATLPQPPGVTILLTTDPPAEVVRPRLEALGADLTYIELAGWDEDPPQLPALAAVLGRVGRSFEAALIVLDPLAAFLPPQMPAADVRAALAALAAVAASNGCAVLLTRRPAHTVGRNAVYRGPGSAGVLDAALTGLLVAPRADDPKVRALALTKAHRGRHAPALGFVVGREPDAPPPPAAGRPAPGAAERHPPAPLTWTGAVDLSADELCAPRGAALARGPIERAAEFLRAALARGPRAVETLKQMAEVLGMSWRTIRRAKDVAGAVAERRRGHRFEWLWRIPSEDPAGDRARRAAVVDARTRKGLLALAEEQGMDVSDLGARPDLDALYARFAEVKGPEWLPDYMAALRSGRAADRPSAQAHTKATRATRASRSDKQ